MSQVVDQGYLWVPVEDCTHDTWITNLVCTLLEAYPEDSFLRQLAPVCRVKVSFSEELLPLLVDLLLCTGKKICQTVVSKNMRYFFKQHYDGHKSRGNKL
uniref:Uncharacterized protein n=1 Tax=Timema monikensis TaxID=170555 RepID=A0A7R9EKP4_9NEOP|nr:unnamed protein product [Timema monikensis]